MRVLWFLKGIIGSRFDVFRTLGLLVVGTVTGLYIVGHPNPF